MQGLQALNAATKKEHVTKFVRPYVLLGDAYFTGAWGVLEPDVPMAISWYEQAASTGNTYAKNTLAQIFIRGLGVHRNEMAGDMLLIQAARDGNPDAQLFYANRLMNPNSRIHNKVEGTRWLLIAGLHSPEALRRGENELAQMAPGQRRAMERSVRGWFNGRKRSLEPTSYDKSVLDFGGNE